MHRVTPNTGFRMKTRVIRVERTRMEEVIHRLGSEATPSVYTDRNVLVRELFWRRLEALLALSRAAERGRVLDFGGGNGVLTPTLSRLYREVVCVDLRTEVVNDLVRCDGLVNVSVHAGQLTSLELPGSNFDTIIAADVMEHVLDLEPVVAEFHRLLVAGGELLVSAPSENRFYQLGRRLFGYTKPHDHYHPADLVEQTVEPTLPLARRQYFPVDVSWLAVFSLARFVKPDPAATESLHGQSRTVRDVVGG